MKLYLINNICVSTSPLNGAVEVESPSLERDNPSNYINKRVTVFDGGYKVEVPSEKELSDALSFKEILLLKQGLQNLEQYTLEQEMINI